MKEKINLEISEAKQKYVGKNFAVISSKDMEDLNVVSGDIVKISGEKEAHT